MNRGGDRALLFGCLGDELVGILHPSDDPHAQTAIIVIVGGPQYRVGSHRQFVLIARTLAEAGYPVLRFDVRGMGDSTGSVHGFDSIDTDIAAAIDCVHEQLPSVKRVVLWGLCDGASAALLYCHSTHDARVAGLCLLNPWVRSEASLARTHVKHYYAQRLLQPSFWRKMIAGKVGPNALTDSWRSLRTALRPVGGLEPAAGVAIPYQRRMAEAWPTFNGEIMLVLSGRDFTAKEFVEYVEGDKGWKAGFQRRGLVKHDLPEADHTFSDAGSRIALERLTLEWLSTVPVTRS